MIEVEKKFQPTKEQLASLLADAEFVKEETHTDIYYDLPGFPYFKKGMRFRTRDGAYELKVEIPKAAKNTTDNHEEIDDEVGILKGLGLPAGENLETFIKEKMIVLCALTTKRKTYRKSEFIIDIDETDFGYNMVEIELLVADASGVAEAENKIIALAKEYNFEIRKLPGKIAECLRLGQPKVYEELYLSK